MEKKLALGQAFTLDPRRQRRDLEIRLWGDTYVDILEHVVGEQHSDARRDEDRSAVISRRIAHKRVVQNLRHAPANIHTWLVKLLRTVYT